MASIFSRIVAGELPCHKVAESEEFLAFLDISPLVEGHALVIPKQEVDYLFDLPESTLSKINLFARDVARKMRAVIDCERIGVSVIGLEVPHAHIHLIPINSVEDMNFSRPKLEIDHDRLAQLAKQISEA